MSSEESQSLFSSTLVSEKVQAALPEGYILRPLQQGDWARGHLEPLKDLIIVGDITEEQWVERFEFMKGCKGTYYTLVIVDEKRGKGKEVVATGTLFVEKKFLYKLGVQGHIEDVAVKSDQQGKRLGLRLLEALDYVAEQVGCYKTILDCSPDNVGFYKKCGYEQAGCEMHHYYDAEAEKEGV